MSANMHTSLVADVSITHSILELKIRASLQTCGNTKDILLCQYIRPSMKTNLILTGGLMYSKVSNISERDEW